MEKLATAQNWSEWKVSPKCLEVTLDQELPVEAGMWWLTLPLLFLAVWLYFRDGRLSRRRAGAKA